MAKVTGGEVDSQLTVDRLQRLKQDSDPAVEVVPELRVGLDPGAGHQAGMDIPEHTHGSGAAKKHELSLRFAQNEAQQVRKKALEVIHPRGKTTGTVASSLDRLSGKKPDVVDGTADRFKGLVGEGSELSLEHLIKDVVGPIVGYVEKYADPKNFITKNPIMALVNMATKGGRDERFATAAKVAVAGLEGIQERDPPAEAQLTALRKLSRALTTGFLAHTETRSQLRGLEQRVDALTNGIWEREAKKVGTETIDEIARTAISAYAQFAELEGLLDSRVRSLQFGDRKFPSHGRAVSRLISGASQGLDEALRQKATQLVEDASFLQQAPYDDLQALWKNMVDLTRWNPSPDFQATKAKLAEALITRMAPLEKDASLQHVHSRVSWLVSLRDALPEDPGVRKTIAAEVGTLAAHPATTTPQREPSDVYAAIRRFDQLTDIAAQLPKAHPTLPKVNTERLQQADMLLDYFLTGLSKASDYNGARWDISHLGKLQEALNPTLDAAGRETLQARIDEAHSQYEANKEAKEAAKKEARSRTSYSFGSSRKRPRSSGMSMEMKVALMGSNL